MAGRMMDMPDHAASNDGRPRGRGLPGWATRLPAWCQDRERMAIYLLVGFLAVWLLTMLVIQGVVAARHGYGLGIEGHQHVPAALVKQIGVGDNLDKMMKATNKP
jgi:hypothetical protein